MLDLNDFLGEPASQPASPETGVCEDPSSSPAAARGDEPQDPATAGEGVPSEDGLEGSSEPPVKAPLPEPEFVTEVTPAGIEVLYQWAPKRLYRLRRWDRVAEDEDGPKWTEVPSVTTVLGIVDKSGALTWWGMKIGVEAVLELARRGLVIPAKYPDGNVLLSVSSGMGTLVPATAEKIVDKPRPDEPSLITREKLSVNHVRDEAGDRGTNVHKAFEDWSKHGIIPVPDIYPEHERGYIEGLLAFLRESHVEPEATEVMVGSLEHRFAGRYDLRGRFPHDVELIFHRTPKKGDQRTTYKAGSYLLDLKTSKDFYETHFLQLEGYELASIECGYEPTQHRMVIVVDDEGRYKVAVSKATGEDFLAVKGAYDALEGLRARMKRRKS